MAPLVWVITGCSSGMGKDFAKDLLHRGDKVIATARRIEMLNNLKELGAHVMTLDITAPESVLKEKAEEASKFEGRIDGLVNNAGYVLLGTMEEMTNDDLKKQFETNVYGQKAVTRAFCPYIRAVQGTIVFISSITSYNVVPGGNAYSISKGAVDSMARAFNLELQPFGVKVFLVTPGYYRTRIMKQESIGDVHESLISRNEVHYDTSRGGVPNHIPEYDDLRAGLAHHLKTKSQPGDPVKAAKAMFDIIKAEGDAEGREPPFQIFLGKDAYEQSKAKLQECLDSLEKFGDITAATDLDPEQQQ